ncbi:hypothetical protein [Mangrovicoccus sp. HB161399]|uniref:hypothetical protein n=1 Tax=Mangrovicoccus sp. HB161399 TaxID=2720392 RepID=UPI001552650D|nr:hypothetical protein [Mangrovicoccus sp. HB161399]
MIELAFVICLAANESHCEDRSLLYADVGLMACMMQGQAHLAEWIGRHPAWILRSWRCRAHEPGRAEA